MSVDYLTEDSVRVPNQNYVCLSFLTDKLSEEEVKNNVKRDLKTLSGVKISGCFDKYEEACAHAKRLQTANPYFNVFVGEVGKWLPYDPCPSTEAAGNPEYANEELNKMMKAYLENQEKAKIYHDQRKAEMMRKNYMESLTSRKENRVELEQKLTLAKTETERKGLEENIKNIDDQIKKIENKTSALDTQLQELMDQLKAFEPKQVIPPAVPSAVNLD